VPSSVYRVTISPADVGARVMVRRRLSDGREGFGDVVGDLLSWSDDVLTIRTPRSGDVTVDAATVVAGKRVPPPASRRGGEGR
jgi:hypothetical protein